MSQKKLKLKKAGILTRSIVLCLCFYSVINMFLVLEKLDEAETLYEDLSMKIEIQNISNSSLQELFNSSLTDEDIAEIARERLGLVMPEEIFFYAVS